MTEETKSTERVVKESSVKEAGSVKENAPEDKQGEGPGEEKMSPPDFSSFVFSISTTVLMDLGEIEHPIEKEKKVNLTMAKHSIDVLDMLKDKTKGNLTEQESALIENIVADLKLRYCNKVA